MALLDTKSRTYLKTKFEQELVRPVTVELFRGEQNPETTAFAEELVRELAGLHPNLHLEVKQLADEGRELHLESSPTLLIGRELGYHIEYWGAPLGMEAEGFVDAILLAARGESGLTKASVEMLGLLPRPARVYSFVTPTCPFCPKSAMQNHRLAVAAPGRIRSICVEAQQNPELSNRFHVSSVPQQLFDEQESTVSVGAQAETGYVRALLEHTGVERAGLESIEQAARAELLTLPAEPDHPLHLQQENFREAVKKYPFLVVDCWAEWCGPCRMMAPVIDTLAHDLKGRVAFGKLDTEENQAIAVEYQINSIPTLLIFQNGELRERLVGFKPKPVLQKEIEKLLLKN